MVRFRPSSRPSCSVRAGHWHDLDCYAQVPDGDTAERAVEDGHGFAAGLDARAARHVRLVQRQRRGHVRTFAGEPGPDRIKQSCAHCMLLSEAGGYLQSYSSGLYDWVKPQPDAEPVLRCSIMDVVSCFPEVLQQLWVDVSVRCPHAERYHESALETRVAAGSGKLEKPKRYGAAVRSLVFETCGRLGGCDCSGVPSCCSGALASGPCLRLSCRGKCGARASCLSDLEVLFSRLSCEGASDRDSVRDRDRDRSSGCIASCVPSSLFAFVS